MQSNAVHYADYLELDKLLNAQQPESSKNGAPLAHDEMLFIIIHQTYELWFKQILFEVDSVIAIMHQPVLNDNAADLQTVVHRLKRVATILKTLVQQVDIIETMTPMDFLDFRDMLRPASGFQSWQFKILEAKLGLRFEQRYGKTYYTSQLHAAEIALIKEAENTPSLMMLLNIWLGRMPFVKDITPCNSNNTGDNRYSRFFATYEAIYTVAWQRLKKIISLFLKQFFTMTPATPTGN